MGGDVTLRPLRWPEDEPFLQALYASTRVDELAQVPWTVEQKGAFCRMQFAAQHQHYQEHYAGATFDVIELSGQPGEVPRSGDADSTGGGRSPPYSSPDGVAIGRLYVARWADEIRIIDIALLPGYRGRGIGTTLIKQVLAEGEAAGKPVSIHVEHFNPAVGLYRRLGFEVVEERGAYLFLRWTAEGK
jgi:ribosomal protein S18 acetylase RimI-like enzyme